MIVELPAGMASKPRRHRSLPQRGSNRSRREWQRLLRRPHPADLPAPPPARPAPNLPAPPVMPHGSSSRWRPGQRQASPRQPCRHVRAPLPRARSRRALRAQGHPDSPGDNPRAKAAEADYFSLLSAHLNRRKTYPPRRRRPCSKARHRALHRRSRAAAGGRCRSAKAADTRCSTRRRSTLVRRVCAASALSARHGARQRHHLASHRIFAQPQIRHSTKDMSMQGYCEATGMKRPVTLRQLGTRRPPPSA